jgi:hypothetical protein
MNKVWGYKWKCPVDGCGREGKKYIRQCGARRGFKLHMRVFHNKYSVDPIIVTKKLEGGKSVWEIKKR